MLAVNIVLLVAGQMVWKIGLSKAGGLHLGNWTEVLVSPYIWAGIAMYGTATVLWLAVLSRLPLSVAYPLQSAAYVLGLLAAAWLLREVVPPHRWLGVAVIAAGIAMVSWRAS
ncbi:membrane protein [Gordoniibacillus kamchatkensis]|uniref:Membrane protein n=1 Tax=Gordoniibacillus kamchatkensis TaxID=1590651 RepID=A0ABR5AI64_9BACL|nr:membrane protein [Paenibacillus sp. VKM B-2647]